MIAFNISVAKTSEEGIALYQRKELELRISLLLDQPNNYYMHIYSGVPMGYVLICVFRIKEYCLQYCCWTRN